MLYAQIDHHLILCVIVDMLTGDVTSHLAWIKHLDLIVNDLYNTIIILHHLIS